MPSPPPVSPRLLTLAFACALLTASCAPPIGVRRIRPEEANRALTASVLTTGEPGATSSEYLYRLDLARRYREDPAGTLATLHAGLGSLDEPDRLFALSELSYAYAERGGGQPYFLASAVYAWSFLFPEQHTLRPSRYDPRLRTALDIYNRALPAGLAGDDPNEVDLSPRSAALPFGSLEVAIDPAGFHFGGYELTHFTSLADFAVYGLRNRYRRRGIGAPLAATAARSGDRAVDRWIPPRGKVPVTALLRFDQPRRAMSAGGQLRGTLELYDDSETQSITVGRKRVPLEAESTATLAYRLHNSPLWDFEIAGFRSGDFDLFGTKQDSTLFMLHPYHRGRIPVVFVHGTASSPARWAEMANEISNDPVLGSRYQLWYFIYNTGNPIAYSAMRLREALQDVIAGVDPQGTDASLRKMVVVGHSQGGLLTKSTAVSSGTHFWEDMSSVSFDEAELSAETRDLFRRTLFLEPLPFVKRLIFIATPHRGSFLADNFLGNIARRLINLPATITKIGVEMVKLQAAGVLRLATGIPTSIDNMKSSNSHLRTLAALPIAPTVHAHSIIAVNGDGPYESGNDGVVAYSSAHIDGVDSELVVRSTHSTQGTPETIEEVRRILYVHLEEP